MILAAPILDTHALAQLIWVSLLAGVGICAVYAVAVVGITRFQERRRAGQHAASALYGAVAALALAGCVWAVVAGVAAMTTK